MIEQILDRLTAVMFRVLGPAIRISNRVLDRLPRPLDPFRSIKLKLAILLGLAGTTGITVFWFGIGWIAWKTAFAAAAVGLITLQIFAHGMTKPLREMTAAARGMARGEYTRRVRATSRDEVGDLARAFNQMATDLGTADQQRRELIANVSHELRTPITALQGVLENLVDGVAEPDPEQLKTALAQTERLGRLVTELLDLSRLDAGVVALRVEELHAAKFLADSVAQARLAWPEITFELAPPDRSLRLQADPARLHQVFANLLDNAARHSPQDGTVTLTACQDGSTVQFEVIDAGPGIAPDLRERVFERFTRGDRSGTDGGTGLGLAIARWVVELHRGTISIADGGSGGSTGCRVRVILPILL
jgi:signal transduction histidine kinase